MLHSTCVCFSSVYTAINWSLLCAVAENQHSIVIYSLFVSIEELLSENYGKWKIFLSSPAFAICRHPIWNFMNEKRMWGSCTRKCRRIKNRFFNWFCLNSSDMVQWMALWCSFTLSVKESSFTFWKYTHFSRDFM